MHLLSPPDPPSTPDRVCVSGFDMFVRQLEVSSPDLTLNGGLYREEYQNGLELGIGIIPSYPDDS